MHDEKTNADWGPGRVWCGKRAADCVCVSRVYSLAEFGQVIAVVIVILVYSFLIPVHSSLFKSTAITNRFLKMKTIASHKSKRSKSCSLSKLVLFSSCKLLRKQVERRAPLIQQRSMFCSSC